jgi:hypothetical protein
MNETYHNAKRKELDEKWATFFYEANVPFNVVRHPSFIATMQATLLARFDYKPPSYHAMRTTFIEPTKNLEESLIGIFEPPLTLQGYFFGGCVLYFSN